MDSIMGICYDRLPEKESRIRKDFIEPLEKEISILKEENLSFKITIDKLSDKIADMSMQQREWIKFETEFDKETETDILCNYLPNEDDEVLVTDGVSVWVDTFMYDSDGYYFDSGFEIIGKITHWMPLPELPKED